jgi:aquaporin NIP
MQPSFVRRLIAELVGTFGFFFFGFVGIATAATHPDAIGSGGVAAGFGLGLAMMIFAFGHISGGHFNPAVTFGLAVGRRFPWVELPAYWGAQLVGGLFAAFAVEAIFGDLGASLVNAPGSSVSSSDALVLEIVATFLFLLVISAVATDERAAWHGILAPVAIGGFIFTAATVIGPISGGSFNPARSLAPAITAGEFSDVWIYIVGPLVGGALGGLFYSYLRVSGTAAEVREKPLVDDPD